MSSSGLEIHALAPSEDAAADAFARAHPRGSIFHLSGWRQAVEHVFGHEPCSLAAFRGTQLVGSLPLMATRTLRGRLNLLSMPYGVYGGPIGADATIEQALLAAAVQLADSRKVGHLELRYQYDPGPELVGSSLYWSFVRELPATPAEVLARMPKKARAEARKARERHQLELSSGVWYVDDLYRLFLRNKHELGSPGLPHAFFRELLATLKGAVQVHLVRREREPLSAVMTFAFEDTLTAYYSGTQQGADRAYSASNFMYLALQEWAVEHGFKRFDFGRSRRDSGAFQFKEHQGFSAAPLHYRYHLVQDRSTPSFTPSNPKTVALRETWSRLPLWVARRASDRLARFLP